MLYEFFNQYEYLDINVLKGYSIKSSSAILQEYVTLISKSFDHYIVPSFDKKLNLSIIFNSEKECSEIFNEIHDICILDLTKSKIFEKILFFLKKSLLKYDFKFIPKIELNKNNYVDDKIIVDCNLEQTCINISCIYDFFIFIKIYVGDSSDDFTKMMGGILKHCLNKANNILDFEFIVEPIIFYDIYPIYFNIYCKKCGLYLQYLLMTDIFANNPLLVNKSMCQLISNSNFIDFL